MKNKKTEFFLAQWFLSSTSCLEQLYPLLVQGDSKDTILLYKYKYISHGKIIYGHKVQQLLGVSPMCLYTSIYPFYLVPKTCYSAATICCKAVKWYPGNISTDLCVRLLPQWNTCSNKNTWASSDNTIFTTFAYVQRSHTMPQLPEGRQWSRSQVT